MTRLSTLAIAVTGMIASTAAMAQSRTAPSSDQAYCQALSDLYVRYIGHDEDWGRRTMWRSPLDGQVAVAQCKQGKAAAAIPVLEKNLLAQKFTLPARG
jgi:hypothetical protein